MNNDTDDDFYALNRDIDYLLRVQFVNDAKRIYDDYKQLTEDEVEK